MYSSKTTRHTSTALELSSLTFTLKQLCTVYKWGCCFLVYDIALSIVVRKIATAQDFHPYVESCYAASFRLTG